MLVHKLGGIVDDVVDNDEDVLLGVVLGNVLVCVFLRHCDDFGLVRVAVGGSLNDWAEKREKTLWRSTLASLFLSVCGVGCLEKAGEAL